MIDLARYLVGEIASVSASTRTFVKDRDGGTVDVDDAVESVVDFADGAVGTIEATRFASGRKNGLTFEINGSKGSLAFDIERLNELQVHYSRLDAGRARRRASAPCWCPRPTTRSGSTGGPRGT